MFHNSVSPSAAGVLDITAVGITAAALMNWLPPVASIVTIVWIGLNIISWFVNKKWKATKGRPE